MSEPKKITRKYTNGEVTVVWKPDICIHSTLCFRGLPDVFDPRKRPWVTPEGADTARIIEQVKSCPSGALSFYLNEAEVEAGKVELETETIVEVSPNGPLMVYGNVTVKHADGTQSKQNRVTAFCRCGASSNKPFCDGSHRKVGFEG